ncbi:hypothetical protein [Nostoc sp. 106C]|uniref:hypothetical protein n=1 Tax=Nostoc sp. 106C TaxID=1932667 RepID=UPI00117F1E67|nr:hypothetical protein [Nostoc sp. 106C]
MSKILRLVVVNSLPINQESISATLGNASTSEIGDIRFCPKILNNFASITPWLDWKADEVVGYSRHNPDLNVDYRLLVAKLIII